MADTGEADMVATYKTAVVEEPILRRPRSGIEARVVLA